MVQIDVFLFHGSVIARVIVPMAAMKEIAPKACAIVRHLSLIVTMEDVCSAGGLVMEIMIAGIGATKLLVVCIYVYNVSLYPHMVV